MSGWYNENDILRHKAPRGFHQYKGGVQMKLKTIAKKFLICSVAAAMLSASAGTLPFTTASAAETTTITNPVIWADVPDVDVIRVGDTY